MNVNVSYRQMESSPALRDYAVRKLDKICEKYVRGQVDASVVMTAEPFGHVADFTVSVKDETVKGKAQSYDMYGSIDLALEKIEKQLRRYNDRMKDHQTTDGRARRFKMGVLTPPGGSPQIDEEEPYDDEFAEDYERYPAPEELEESTEGDGVQDGASAQAVQVLRNDEYEAEPMTVDEAVDQLQSMDEKEFYVFSNVDTDTISIVYRRNDDNIGLIETD
ncbi:MAG: ribosome hibernation-promoting factor, HPF/YfiA family [Bradymonadaceae bacterium]